MGVKETCLVGLALVLAAVHVVFAHYWYFQIPLQPTITINLFVLKIHQVINHL